MSRCGRSRRSSSRAVNSRQPASGSSRGGERGRCEARGLVEGDAREARAERDARDTQTLELGELRILGRPENVHGTVDAGDELADDVERRNDRIDAVGTGGEV